MHLWFWCHVSTVDTISSSCRLRYIIVGVTVFVYDSPPLPENDSAVVSERTGRDVRAGRYLYSDYCSFVGARQGLVRWWLCLTQDR